MSNIPAKGLQMYINSIEIQMQVFDYFLIKIEISNLKDNSPLFYEDSMIFYRTKLRSMHTYYMTHFSVYSFPKRTESMGKNRRA